MSEKGEGTEEVTLNHFYHEHPLSLNVLIDTRYGPCYGCGRYIFAGDTAYKCRDKCRSYLLLHEECAEMPREITLSMHPQHTLIQKEDMYDAPECVFCEKTIYRIGYYCTSSDLCKFQIHVGCARSGDIIHAATGERSCMNHPSHPHHELTLMWRPGRAASLRCDACGTIEKGNFYICTVCQYSIHESCATLPDPLIHPQHEHHLSLVYHLPQEYAKFDFWCDVCFKLFLPKNWVYHCPICRYIVHIKCAMRKSPTTTSPIDANADVITFPINNPVEELIQPFVKKLGGMVMIPGDEKEIQYKFHNPNHRLRLISSSLPHDQEQEDGNEHEKDCSDDDDDDDGLYYGKLSKLVCDGCTEPIFVNKEKYPSNSNDKYYSYISCEECKFYLHLPCFQLPLELTSSLTHKPDHKLILRSTPPKTDFRMCRCCRVYTNGLFYECEECSYFKADIKCISLPETIKHAAHPNHLLRLLSEETTREDSYDQLMCAACGLDTRIEVCYRCDTCGIIFHSRCCLLPPQVSSRRYDKHPLRLTFNATRNRPGEFYCDVCERQMNPKMWMYHCRGCDVSIHPDCFPSVSDDYRNIKFGGRFLASAIHSHPLTFRPLTGRKLRCDLCKERLDYGKRGFQCSLDKCDFFMCFDQCYRWNRRFQLHAVDD